MLSVPLVFNYSVLLLSLFLYSYGCENLHDVLISEWKVGECISIDYQSSMHLEHFIIGIY